MLGEKTRNKCCTEISKTKCHTRVTVWRLCQTRFCVEVRCRRLESYGCGLCLCRGGTDREDPSTHTLTSTSAAVPLQYMRAVWPQSKIRRRVTGRRVVARARADVHAHARLSRSVPVFNTRVGDRRDSPARFSDVILHREPIRDSRPPTARALVERHSSTRTNFADTQRTLHLPAAAHSRTRALCHPLAVAIWNQRTASGQ